MSSGPTLLVGKRWKWSKGKVSPGGEERGKIYKTQSAMWSESARLDRRLCTVGVRRKLEEGERLKGYREIPDVGGTMSAQAFSHVRMILPRAVRGKKSPSGHETQSTPYWKRGKKSQPLLRGVAIVGKRLAAVSASSEGEK